MAMTTPSSSSKTLGNRHIEEILARVAGRNYKEWERQVKSTGYCATPVALKGRSPRTLLVACKNRRESICPSCAETYRRDAWQIVAAGIRGGKGVPESVRNNPMVFVTLTAESFGYVHRQDPEHYCLPRRDGSKCKHGVTIACWGKHGAGNLTIGDPICPECYDYERAVLWNALAPELWRRTTIYVTRELAKQLNVTHKALREHLRLSFTKVAEYQRRGAVHFHAVFRVDKKAPGLAVNLETLRTAILQAIEIVSAPVIKDEDSSGRWPNIRWGKEITIKEIHACTDKSALSAAAYIAKYSTKSTESVGGLTKKITKAHIERLAITDHVKRFLTTAWHLGTLPELEHLKLHRWAHSLGFKGHWSTKSRHYSTTFKALRRERQAFAKSRSSTATVDCSDFKFVGAGHASDGDRLLVMSAAADASEQRRIAPEETRGNNSGKQS